MTLIGGRKMEYRVFENLDREIEYVNIELVKGRSISKIAIEDYGYKNESSLRKRLTKGNIYKRVGQQFVKSDDSKVVRQAVRQNVVSIEENNVGGGMDIIETVGVTKSAEVTFDVFEEKYKGLVENYDVLIQMIEEYKKSGIDGIKNDGGLVIELPPEEEEEARVTFRINGTVYEEFKAFVKANKQFKVKELVSEALMEFVNRYSK